MRPELRSLSAASRLAAAWGLACALLMPTLALAQQPQPSLAEIARQEAERRKALTAATKVYTKDDVPKSALLPPAPPGTAVPTPEATGEKPGTPAAGEKDEKSEGPENLEKPENIEKDEAYWRGRLTQARETIRRNEMFAQALQTRISSLAADFASRDDPLQRAQVAEDRNKTIAEMEAISKEIKALHQQIADIEADARRAGVPPGWLR